MMEARWQKTDDGTLISVWTQKEGAMMHIKPGDYYVITDSESTDEDHRNLWIGTKVQVIDLSQEPEIKIYDIDYDLIPVRAVLGRPDGFGQVWFFWHIEHMRKIDG